MQTTQSRNLMALLAMVAGLIFIGAGSSFARSSEEVQATAKQRSRIDTIAVPDMQCGMCEERISKALKLPDIEEVSTDAESKRVIVRYNPEKITLNKIRQLIAEAGYDVAGSKATDVARNRLPMCCRPHEGH